MTAKIVRRLLLKKRMLVQTFRQGQQRFTIVERSNMEEFINFHSGEIKSQKNVF